MKKLIAAFLITVAAGAASVAHAAEKVTVFAAASMKVFGSGKADRAGRSRKYFHFCRS